MASSKTFNTHTSNGEGYIRSSNNTYATARNTYSAGFVDTGSGSLLQIGQVNPDSGATYGVNEVFLRFDLSSLPSGAIITGATLKLWGEAGGDASVTDFDIQARTIPDPGALTSGDYIAGTSLAALTLLASQNTSTWSTGAYNSLTNSGSNLTDAITAAIGGVLSMVIVSSRQTNGNTPTTQEYVYTETKQFSGNGPQLVVTYTMAAQVSTNTAGGYGSGQMLTQEGSGAWLSGTGDIYFRVNTNTGSTTVAYNSQDPGAIMRSIMDKYIAQGGSLSYDASTIELTGTTVSYTFNTNTTLEGIKKSLELAPAGWYFYIDQANNMVHFHNKSGAAANRFVLGRDIQDIKPEKRTDDITNIIYFTGGGTPALFAKYTRPGSVGLYGQRAVRYVDQRVTVIATANTIAQALLDQKQSPELRLSFEIVDSNVDPTIGFDLEAITIGSTVGLRNTGGAGSSLWDVAQWDVDYWDFNIKDLSTAVLQIVRMEKSADSAKIYCSTVPPDVSKRIEDINRNLEASQTANNPSIAS